MPAGNHIHFRELEQNVIGSIIIPQYVHIHQDNSPIIRTEYDETQDIGLVSYRNLYTVIKVGTQTLPFVAHIITGMSIPLLLGINYRDAHAEDPETQRKVNTMNTKKIFFFHDNKSATPNLTVKKLKLMHMDMDHGSHAEMTAECKRLGCPKKTIDESRKGNTRVHCMLTQRSQLHQRNESLFNTNVLIQRRRVLYPFIFN